MTSDSPFPLDTLLAQADHVTRLARALVADAASADDVVQATWLDVLRSPPRQLDNARAWLGTIVRRQAQRLLRAASRRRRRELAAARAEDSVASPAELAARLAMHRQLVDSVLALDEPYRQTVVLRFFENLDVDAIAQRTGSPRNTVRSRLQRALQQLRQRLDDGAGGRQRWWPAVLGLSRRRLATEAGAGMATGIALAITMKKLVLVAATLVVGGLVLWSAMTPSLAVPASQVGGTAADARPDVRTDALPVAVTSAEPGPVDRRAIALPPNDAPTGVRRVVDRTGAPVPGVTVRAESPFAVRWQGGDRGWIAGADRSLQIAAADEERLRVDAGFAAQFFAQFAHPEEWRATVLDAGIPERETTSDADGAFTFATGVVVGDEAIAIAGAHVLIRPGAPDGRPWVVGDAVRVTGRVRDEAGQPLADAFALPMCPQQDGPLALHGQLEVRSDDAGMFLVRRGLGLGVLRVRCDGFRTAFVPVAAAPSQQLEVVLQREVPGGPRHVDGIVVDGSGRPIADASVWFGRNGVRTGIDGRFRLPADGVRPQYALTIAAKGFALLQLDEFGATLEAGSSRTEDLLFVLDRKPLAIRGLVLGSDGAPLRGALVGLLDPTLLDISFASVEARLGGFDGGVVAGGDGRFELGGLAERPYRLRAIDPATGVVATSSPLRPGALDAVLRLPTDVRRAVRGRVLAAGAPLAEATVAIGYCTHVTKGGGTQFDEAPAVACDADGRFELPVLPARGAWLVVRVRGANRYQVPVDGLAAAGELTIEVDERRWLQLIGSAFPVARAIRFELADGAIVPTGASLQPSGEAPVLPIPERAVAVLVDRDGAQAVRLELTDDRAVHLRVR